MRVCRHTIQKACSNYCFSKFKEEVGYTCIKQAKVTTKDPSGQLSVKFYKNLCICKPSNKYELSEESETDDELEYNLVNAINGDLVK